MLARVVSLQVGRAADLPWGDGTVRSGIVKTPVDGALPLGPEGFDGDEQADLTVHGGLSKAVYAYPSEHYAFWKTVRAQAKVALWDDALPFGSLGENLTLDGLVESGMWIGDLLRFPDCELAVSEPRFPCFKFNAAMGFKHAAKLMVESAWCGSYLAVRTPGTIEAGQAFNIVPGPREVGIAELFRARMSRASAP
jgi:MOSC domain-containing protein YiiM